MFQTILNFYFVKITMPSEIHIINNSVYLYIYLAEQKTSATRRKSEIDNLFFFLNESAKNV